MGFSVMIRAVSCFSCRNLGHGESESVRGEPEMRTREERFATQVAADGGGGAGAEGEQVHRIPPEKHPRLCRESSVPFLL